QKKKRVFSFAVRSLIRNVGLRPNYSRSEMQKKKRVFSFAVRSLIRNFAAYFKQGTFLRKKDKSLWERKLY
ncbi:MAG: hypothetical protein J6I72_01020, partial [Muribaculaceae bacterium]|nr:hypothetical protein [Muribaculaceae bacterium]